MRTVLIASLRAYARRYVAAAIAVIISVAFVVVIGVLIAGARAGLMASDGAPYRGADYVVYADPGAPRRGPVCCPETLDKSAALDLIARLGVNASGLSRVALPARLESGAPLGAGDMQGETTVGPIATALELRWQKVVAGRFPVRAGEAVMHIWDASAMNVAIGDRIRVGEGVNVTDLEVVGIVESPSTWKQASLYVTWPQYLTWRDHPTFHIGEIAVRGEVGPLAEGMRVQPAERHVTEGLAGLNGGTDAFALMLLFFASIALSVSALVIGNTFSILLAQRRRDFALLRCVGATRRQVERSIHQEAAAIGTLASMVGVLAGIVLGYGALALINALSPRAPMRAPDLPLIWLLAGVVVGTLVTVIASWLPTRRVVKASPLAALRPEHAVDLHNATGRARLALAAFFSVSGLVLLGAAVWQANRAAMIAGGGALFAGILLVGPILVPLLIRGLGALLGPVGRFAAENAARSPHRTATTTAALLIGITLTTAVLTAMATWRTAMDEHRNTRIPIDVAIASLDRPVSSDFFDQVRLTRGVEREIVVNGAMGRITGWNAPIAIVSEPAAAWVARDGGAFARAMPGTIHLDYDAFRTRNKKLGVQPGDWVTVRVGDREARLKAILLGGWGQAAIVAPETLAQLTGTPDPRVVWVRAATDADAVELVRDLHRLAEAHGAIIEDHLQAQAVGNRQLDILTWSVLGLIGLSVMIALIGIANTLALSVLERAREHALLRALGLTRGQLRRMLATEAMLMSTVAAMLGVVIGVGFAWVAYKAVVKPILDQAAMQIPWLSLGLVVLLAALAGLLASLLPVRRAARVPPAMGLSFH
ncbi:ABC transporter permease [Pseudomonas aeruginosa]|nr:FtsX-like permease family protein [Pseudomonas aeruginosa]